MIVSQSKRRNLGEAADACLECASFSFIFFFHFTFLTVFFFFETGPAALNGGSPSDSTRTTVPCWHCHKCFMNQSHTYFLTASIFFNKMCPMLHKYPAKLQFISLLNVCIKYWQTILSCNIVPKTSQLGARLTQLFYAALLSIANLRQSSHDLNQINGNWQYIAVVSEKPTNITCNT